MKKILMSVLACAVLVAGCTPLSTEAPPQLPTSVQNISRAALDFAFNSFDAALYGFDLAMDLKHPAPGSDQAKAIAAAGRKVLGFLNAAEAARRAGNAASYDEAFTNAQSALAQFRTLLGITGTHALASPLPSPVNRQAILNRAA